MLWNVPSANTALKHCCRDPDGEAHLPKSNDLVLWTFNLHNPPSFSPFVKTFDIFFFSKGGGLGERIKQASKF